MFNFTVKYLGFLKAVPPLPFVFDGLLLMWSFLARPGLIDTLDEIESRVLHWDGASKTVHPYGGIQFNCNGKEVGHIHGNGLLDIRFSRKIKELLLADGKIQHHHVFKNSGWVSFYITGKADADYAIKLLHNSYVKIRDGATK